MSADTTIPRYREDIYSTAAILDPYPHYAELRALGPVVWLSRTKVYAVTRYAECKDVLLDDETFTAWARTSSPPPTRTGSRFLSARH